MCALVTLGSVRRVHTLEFEDLSWFPSWLRTCMTNLIVVLSRFIGVVPVLATLVSRALRALDADHVVDLGSGGGGSMPEVIDLVRQEPELADATLTMTDLYPNLDAMEKFADEGSHVRYHPSPVDATDLASAPPGLKTMVNSFHHMRPEQARAILRSAQTNREPLLIYEMGDTRIPLLLWALALPVSLVIVFVMALVLTPFVRPLTFRQLFFTYVIPLIPIFYAWDGQCSLPRIYTPEDLDELLADLPEADDYRWEKGPAEASNGRELGTYLLGMPA